MASSNTTGNETILTTTTTTTYSTSASPTVTGTDGDVYIGAALNLIYAGSTEISFNNCQVSSGRKLVVADNGFATQYIYTEKFIKNTVIPSLQMLARSAATPAKRDSILNQVSVWQQVLDNNAANRNRAAFHQNLSFNGGPGIVSSTTTSSISKISTVEFSMSIDGGLAEELGFEVAGSGVSGGVNVNFKTETGSSTTGTTLTETAISYTLDDDDNEDRFSVDIKKDPVYGTPVFELVSGTASCPAEPGAQPRDEMQLTVPVPAVTGIAANIEAQFMLRLGNTSQSLETRTYLLSFDQSSNPNGAIVTIGGSPVLTPISYTIGYLGEVQVTVSVRKPAASNVFAFEGLRFILTDACGGDSSKSAIISAYFISPCSAISLAEPEDNWVLTASANNQLPLLIKDYNVAGLNTVTVEYSPAGTSNWVTAFTRLASELNPNGANGTTVNWNIQSLQDGAYNIRLKLNCVQGVVYSRRASGLIDRSTPVLYGNPQPADDNYVAGDVISFSYNEKIAVPNLADSNVIVRQLSNNQLIPITATGYDNKMIITPNTSITNLTGDSIRVIVKNMKDQYGNASTVRDTLDFIVGTSLPASGPTALNLSVASPTGNRNSGILTTPVVYKNSDSTIKIYFSLPANAANLMRVNYFISGTAKLGIDYTVAYIGSQPAGTSFNGAQGTIFIPANSNSATLIIKPVSNYLLEPDKTIIINLNEGGDYLVGATNSIGGIITSEDNVSTYTFTGNGNFDVNSNWLNGKRPLQTLIAGKQIIIDPTGSVCNLNVPLAIRPGSTLTIKTGKEFIVPSIQRLQ